MFKAEVFFQSVSAEGLRLRLACVVFRGYERFGDVILLFSQRQSLLLCLSCFHDIAGPACLHVYPVLSSLFWRFWPFSHRRCFRLISVKMALTFSPV